MPKIHYHPYTPNQLVLFPQRIDEDIADNDPVRIVNAIVDGLDLEAFKKLYKEKGRSPYPHDVEGHPLCLYEQRLLLP